MKAKNRALISAWMLFFLTTSAYAQKEENGNNLKGQGTAFIELFGNGGVYSVNYDRIFYHKRSNVFTWRAGGSFLPASDGFPAEVALLGEANYLRGRVPHFFEAGLGLTLGRFLSKADRTDVFLVERIGYRYQKADRGFFLRVGFTPFILLATQVEQNVFLHGGLSVGYTFKCGKGNRREKDPEPILY